MMKKMHKYLLLALAITAVLSSCDKELVNPEEAQEIPVETIIGHPVTIFAGLPAETKITHVYEDNKIKPYWADNDELTVSFTKDGNTVTETFTLKDGANTQSATFYNESSQLEDNMPFTVDYVDANHPDGWAVQDGTLDNLPECLSASVNNLSEAVTLKPALTYFHIIFSDFTGGTFTSAYLSKLEGAFSIYSKPGVKGAITVTPASSFTSGSVDFYIAVKIDGDSSESSNDSFGDTTSPKLQIAFGDGIQGISDDGQAFDPAGPSYKYNWSPAKKYTAGKVYKIADKTFTATTASQAMPR